MDWQPQHRKGFKVVGRGHAAGPAESDADKAVLLPELGNRAPRDHAWAVARFACDTMAEHARFFALLMPPEVAPQERLQAIAFHDAFERSRARLDAAGPPSPSDLRAFVRGLKLELQPFIEFKARLHRAQVAGRLQSFVWPLFFDHTRREAEHWVARLDQIQSGKVIQDRRQVMRFWIPVMDEHFRFLAHLFDPDEYTLVRKAYRNSASFQALQGTYHGTATLLGDEPAPATEDEPNKMLAMAHEVVEFQTDAVRQIEAGRIQGIVTPALADHERREALWFLDDVKRLDA